MDDNSHELLQMRLARLETRLRLLQGAWGLTVLALAAASCAALRGPGSMPSHADGVLRARGLVIEDAQGRARILVGAPVPVVTERRRRDPSTGLVVLTESGADRLQVGQVGNPQMGGVVQQRNSPATGLMVNDRDGEERGGFGVFENGQVGWGLDYPGREAVVAAVIPERGFAGLVLNADTDNGNPTRAALVTTKEGNTTLSLSDAAGIDRGILAVRGTDGPALEVFDKDGKRTGDALSSVGPTPLK